jgi:DNA-binding response OmpR family regulator
VDKNRLLKVLLVEDEEDAREILAFYLGNVFDEVDVASNGQEGFEKFLEKKHKNIFYDVIVTDIKMPKKDGLTMLEEIASINEEQKFIIVSAYKDEEYLFKSINLNVISYFVKPLEVKNMMEMLKKLKSKVLEDKSNEPIEEEVVDLNSTYQYNRKTNLLYRNDELVNLSKKEKLLLEALVKNIKEIKTKEYLKKYIWNNENTSDATMRTVIKRVKDKIADDDFIVSKKGLGYLIESGN